MKRSVVTVCLLVAMLASIVAVSPVNAQIGAEPILAVDITSPLGGEVPPEFDAGTPVTLEGVAEVTGFEAETAAVVFAIDLSGSVNNSGGACGTILNCQIAALNEVNANLPARVVEAGLVTFTAPASVTAPAFDFNGAGNGAFTTAPPGEGTDFLAAPGAEFQPAIDAIGSAGGGTSYAQALNRAVQVLATASADEQIIVLITDGAANDGTAPAGITVIGVQIGAATVCTVGLDNVSDPCITVQDPSTLGSVIEDQVAPVVDDVSAEARFGTGEVPTVEPIDLGELDLGQTTVPFSGTWTPPVDYVGSAQLCVTATSDALEAFEEQCVWIEVIDSDTTVVDCADPASNCDVGIVITDENTTAAIRFPAGFDEVVRLGFVDCDSPPLAGLPLPERCNGQIDIEFDDAGATGIIKVLLTRNEFIPRSDRFVEIDYAADESQNQLAKTVTVDRACQLFRRSPTPCRLIVGVPEFRLGGQTYGGFTTYYFEFLAEDPRPRF